MKKKVIIGLVIAVAALALIAVSIFKAGGNSFSIGGRAYSVKAVKIEKGDISSFVSASGVVEETEKAVVYFDNPLKVNEVLVEEGDRVVKGQKILDLDISSIERELEKLEANKTVQELSLNSAVGEAEVQRAQSAVDNAERNYESAKEDYLENIDLYSAGAVSKDVLKASEKAYKSAESALNDAKKALQAAIDSKRISENSNRANLKVTELSIEGLKKNLKDAKDGMYSPMDGVVAALNVEKGVYTATMQPAYIIINPQKLKVRADIKEFDSKNVAVGQEVRITGDAIDKETELKGQIASISPVATVRTTAGGSETVVEVLVDIDDAEGMLKPGFNVTCDVFTVNKTGVVVLPMETINEDKDGNKSVFVIDPKSNTLSERKIKTGIYSDMYVEVVEGLSEGELVVADVYPFYRDGTKVKVTEIVNE